MIIDFTKLLTEIVGLSRLVVLAWAKQVINLFHNFRGEVFFPGSDDHESIQ